MKKLVGARRASRRRGAVAVVVGTVLVFAALVALAAPAYANWVSIRGDCDEVVVDFHDFDRVTTVHINVEVEDGDGNSIGTKSPDVDADNSTPPRHIDIRDLTSQSDDGRVKVKVDVDWVFDGEPHHDDNHIHLDCSDNTTTTEAPTTTPPTTTSPTSIVATTTTVASVTTAGQPETTTTAPGTISTLGNSGGPTTALQVGGESAAAGGSSLPFTGGGSLPLLLVGLSLVIGGATAVIAPRYRRNSS